MYRSTVLTIPKFPSIKLFPVVRTNQFHIKLHSSCETFRTTAEKILGYLKS